MAKIKQQEKPVPVVGNVTATPDGNFTGEVVAHIVERPESRNDTSGTSDDTAEIVVPPAAGVEPLPPVAPAPVARDHGFGTWLVHTPGHTAARTVQASSAAEAVEQYKALMGITTLPAAAVAERVADTPAE